jgi:branched-chain amino acid transport system ATP-binding protein
MPAAVLTAQDVSVAYGDLVAVADVSVQVSEGSIVGVLGPNGAGKTTTLRALAGSVLPVAGTVRWHGGDITRVRPEDRVRLGIGLVQEGRHVFRSLPVRDNLLLGAYSRRDRKEIGRSLERVLELFPALRGRLRQKAGTLSGGEQQMVAIGRALMSNLTCLLIDEPSLGLAPLVIDGIYRTLSTLRGEGVSIVVVEQEIQRILQIADHVYVLREGHVVGSGPSASFRAEPQRLTDLYLGTGA